MSPSRGRDWKKNIGSADGLSQYLFVDDLGSFSVYRLHVFFRTHGVLDAELHGNKKMTRVFQKRFWKCWQVNAGILARRKIAVWIVGRFLTYRTSVDFCQRGSPSIFYTVCASVKREYLLPTQQWDTCRHEFRVFSSLLLRSSLLRIGRLETSWSWERYRT